MKEWDLWMRRGDPTVRLEYLSSIIIALAAAQPSEAMTAVRAAQSMFFMGIDDEILPELTWRRFCHPEAAVFDTNEADHPTLDAYVRTLVLELAKMSKIERYKRIGCLNDGDWTLSICLDPAFAIIKWCEQQDDHRVVRVARWVSAPNEMRLGPSGSPRGVERLTSIPPVLFRVAADIYAETFANFADTVAIEPSPLDAAPASASSETENADFPARKPASSRAYAVRMDHFDSKSNDQECGHGIDPGWVDMSNPKRECESTQGIIDCVLGRPFQPEGCAKHELHSRCATCVRA